MLFLLTGDIQIGKTRWLQALVDRMLSEGVTCFGVLAPGIWKEKACREDGAATFEKLGIDNVLLPQKETVHFAIREDLAKADGSFNGESQAAQAKLAWHISDEAIDQVNAHFAGMHDAMISACSASPQSKGILIIDELGRLELLHGQGLTEASKILEEGPQGCVQNAILIVRNTLSDIAQERFSDVWGGSLRIGPDDASAKKVLDAVLG